MNNFNRQNNYPFTPQWQGPPVPGQNATNSGPMPNATNTYPLMQSHGNLMATQQGGPSTATFRGPQPQLTATAQGGRPPIKDLATAKTGVYQGWIQSPADHEASMKEYLTILNCEPGDHSDIPVTDAEYRVCIKRLFDAMQDLTNTVEPQDSQNVNRIRETNYSDIEYELVLWPLLRYIVEAQKGHCPLPGYLDHKKQPAYNKYNTFEERLAAVENALRKSKDIVVSVFRDGTFAGRLAWRPQAELKQKQANRKLNREREVRRVHRPRNSADSSNENEGIREPTVADNTVFVQNNKRRRSNVPESGPVAQQPIYGPNQANYQLGIPIAPAPVPYPPLRPAPRTYTHAAPHLAPRPAPYPAPYPAAPSLAPSPAPAAALSNLQSQPSQFLAGTSQQGVDPYSSSAGTQQSSPLLGNPMMGSPMMNNDDENDIYGGMRFDDEYGGFGSYWNEEE
ncbi:hypothetical protein F5Y04DRAFT_282764 [Hypomontagnella monticulosa]|nr:hypothetical protein F5Y04DRAFT_282764 [Hypomontagnella monticulosa]